MEQDKTVNNITEGGCFCGSVRYSFESYNYPSANCHCSMCRRTSGAAFRVMKQMVKHKGIRHRIVDENNSLIDLLNP